LFCSVQWYHSLNILFLVWYIDLFRIWWVYCCSMKLLCNVVFRNLSQVCWGSWHLCRFLCPVRAVKCCLPCYWEVLLYLSVLILVCVVDFDILRFCLSSCYMCVVAAWFGLPFVFLVKLFGIFWLVCLVSGVLMGRMLFSGPYCWEKFRITCTF